MNERVNQARDFLVQFGHLSGDELEKLTREMVGEEMTTYLDNFGALLSVCEPQNARLLAVLGYMVRVNEEKQQLKAFGKVGQA